MKHIENNSIIAIGGEWFTAHGKGINLGYFGIEENHRIAEKLKNVFFEWIDNGHNNFDDENTIIYYETESNVEAKKAQTTPTT